MIQDQAPRSESTIALQIETPTVWERVVTQATAPAGAIGSLPPVCSWVRFTRRRDLELSGRGPRTGTDLVYYSRPSSTMLKGPSVALRTLPNPAPVRTSVSFSWPACAPKAAPTSCAKDVGTQTMVDAL